MSEISNAIARTRPRMEKVFSPNQVLGRSRAIGCVAVEITQRCNLDCTLCYLSESAEDVADIPMELIFERLDSVRKEYGPGTNVQITGGDPTLRKHTELIEIVAYAHNLGLHPALFTNGIAASRKLLTQLSKVGLCEVAFHVDTTQERAGYESEADLNEIRKDYIERARGLDINVLFNTTVHADNFHEVPELTKFFVNQVDVVSFASFQLQADTGRGVWSKRGELINIDNTRQRIQTGVGRELTWDAAQIGHPLCHSYSPNLVINQNVYPVMDDKTLMAKFLAAFKDLHTIERGRQGRTVMRALKIGLLKPIWVARFIGFIGRHIWNSKSDLLKSKGKIQRISFFIHNFMDADHLDQERLDACSFMVETHAGPVSMCAHNAHRDEYILKPITFHKKDGQASQYIPIKPVDKILEKT